jgi:TolA-binding protein
MGRVSVVGREEPVELFEPLGEAEEERRDAGIGGFEAALGLYEEGRFAEAAEAFALFADDPPAASYETRCRILAAAPPPRWDGIWNATEKG